MISLTYRIENMRQTNLSMKEKQTMNIESRLAVAKGKGFGEGMD